MSRFLITSDLHLTERTADEYRFEIFKWLRTNVRSRKADAVFILGDVTDSKDRHPARLVNRIVRELRSVAKLVPVFVLKGNHDYHDESTPFFGFLADKGSRSGRRSLGGPEKIPLQSRGLLRFLIKPTDILFGSCRILLIPHTRSWKRDTRSFDFKDYDYIFCHQTFAGARASNGVRLEGTPLAVLSKDKTDATVVSGDIHVPQKLGNVFYCGSPHPIRIGDDFSPRVILLDGEAVRSIDRITIRKSELRIRGPKELTGEEGDQVRIVVELPRDRLGEWPDVREAVRRAADLRGLRVSAIVLEALEDAETRPEEASGSVGSAPELLYEYCESRGIEDRLAEIGREFLGDA